MVRKSWHCVLRSKLNHSWFINTEKSLSFSALGNSYLFKFIDEIRNYVIITSYCISLAMKAATTFQGSKITSLPHFTESRDRWLASACLMENNEQGSDHENIILIRCVPFFDVI